MTYDLDQDLRSLRPTDREIDEELGQRRRTEILASVLRAEERHVRRTAAHPVARRVILVAAAAVVVASVLGVSSVLPERLAPVVSQTATAGTLRDLAARAAGRGALAPIGPGEYLAVVTVEQQTGAAPIRQEAYVASDGWTWRRDTEGFFHRYLLYRADPGLDVDGLPTRPAELEQVLRAQPLGTQSPDEGVFKLVGEIVRTESAPSEVRRASLELLAEMATRTPRTQPAAKGGETTPDVSADTGRIDQRSVTGATLTDLSQPGRSTTYWFDDETSELVRTTQTFPGGDTFSSEILDRRVVDGLPDDVVDKLGTDRVEKFVK